MVQTKNKNKNKIYKELSKTENLNKKNEHTQKKEGPTTKNTMHSCPYSCLIIKISKKFSSGIDDLFNLKTFLNEHTHTHTQVHAFYSSVLLLLFCFFLWLIF